MTADARNRLMERVKDSEDVLNRFIQRKASLFDDYCVALGVPAKAISECGNSTIQQEQLLAESFTRKIVGGRTR